MKNMVKVFSKLMLLGFAGVSFSWQAATAQEVFENPVIGEKGYHVGSYGNGAYWVSNGLTNSMFLVTDDGVVVVDAPPAYADKLPEAIAEVTDQPVTHFVYSHFHKDHNGGAGVFGDDVTYVGHALTAEELARVNDPNRPVPTVTFDETLTLELGGETVELTYPGLNHTPGNIIIFLPNQKTLMLVDTIYPGVAPFARLGVTAHVPGYYDFIEKAMQFDFEVFQGGHLGRPGTREDFELSREFVLDLKNIAQTAVQITRPPLAFMDPDSPIADPYYGIDAYFDVASDACAQIAVERWSDRLAGVGAFAKSQCWTLILDARID